MLNKLIGALIVIGVAVSIFQEWVWIPVLILILLFIIRLLADVYWQFKDRGDGEW